MGVVYNAFNPVEDNKELFYKRFFICPNGKPVYAYDSEEHHTSIALRIIGENKELKALYRECEKKHLLSTGYNTYIMFLLSLGYIWGDCEDDDFEVMYNSISTPQEIIDEIEKEGYSSIDAAGEIKTYSSNEQKELKKFYETLLKGKKEAERIEPFFKKSIEEKAAITKHQYFLAPDGTKVFGSIENRRNAFDTIASNYVLNNPEIAKEYKATRDKYNYHDNDATFMGYFLLIKGYVYVEEKDNQKGDNITYCSKTAPKKIMETVFKRKVSYINDIGEEIEQEKPEKRISNKEGIVENKNDLGNDER